MIYLGIDWGKKSIGLAISEGIQASPLGVLSVDSLISAVSQIKKVVIEENIDILVVGKPESGEALKMVESGIKSLQKEGLEVVEADETLSSYDSKGDHSKAAAIILQNYLDDLGLSS